MALIQTEFLYSIRTDQDIDHIEYDGFSSNDMEDLAKDLGGVMKLGADWPCSALHYNRDRSKQFSFGKAGGAS